MDIGFRRHGHEKGHFVHQFCLFWKDTAHPATALTMLCKLERAFHDGAGRGNKSFWFFFRPEHLAVKLFERRFVVKRIHRAGSAGHKKLDDALDLRWMMRNP